MATLVAGHEGFRNNEIHFLQEQNRLVLSSLEKVEHERNEAFEVIQGCEETDSKLQTELMSVSDRISALQEKLSQDKTESVAKDEHVRVLSEQNKQMLSLLEAEETKSRERAKQIQTLEAKNKKLQKIAEAFDAAKAEIERQVAEARAKSAETVATMKGQRSLNETLRANIQNTEAKTRVDIDALSQALQVVNQKNIEYLSRINKQTSKEQQLQAETENLKEEVEAVRSEIDKLRKQLEGDQDGRSHFERARGQMENSIQALEVQADTLKKALSTAERANEHLQEENRTSAERSRETADKVYALMDSLRLNQVELKKQEAENAAKEKKIQSLERQSQNLQAKTSMETDAKVLAEQERKEAEQEAIVLKKKNKKIEESVAQSQTAQEKAEKEIVEFNDRVGGLQTQNAYLASRIDGQEEERNGMKAEIKKVADRTTQLSSENSKLRDEVDRIEEQIATAGGEKLAMQKELEYIKREDVLDEAGRQRPILIQSTESDLLEKLQINEFLYDAQQARNPIPPLIEKVAQMLAMLHDGQQRADQYLSDLSKSNGLVSAMRQRNLALFTRTQMFESFKTRALLKYVMNLIEGDLASDLHLDSLSFGPRELTEMVSLLQRYDATDKVYVISLVDNGLDEESINLLLQLIYVLPYLRSLDLRRNCISTEGIKRVEAQLKGMEGVTGVVRNGNHVINVHSGNMLRLCVDLSEQVPKDQVAQEVDFTVQHDLAHGEADPFLASEQGGMSHHPWTKSPAGQMRSPQQAVPDPSSVELAKTTGAPTGPVIGGPPVGLGGPGNVASLNKKHAKAEPKKRGDRRRAKAAPPPALECMPIQRSIDRGQAGRAVLTQSLSLSKHGGDRLSALSALNGGEHREHREQRLLERQLERYASMPVLRPRRSLGAPRI